MKETQTTQSLTHTVLHIYDEVGVLTQRYHHRRAQLGSVQKTLRRSLPPEAGLQSGILQEHIIRNNGAKVKSRFGKLGELAALRRQQEGRFLLDFLPQSSGATCVTPTLSFCSAGASSIEVSCESLIAGTSKPGIAAGSVCETFKTRRGGGRECSRPIRY